MELKLDDSRLLHTWRLLATSSGHLDSTPKVDSAVISFERSPKGRLRFAATARLRKRSRSMRGTIAVRPATMGPRTWGGWIGWVATSPLHGHLLATDDATVIAAVTPGSMLLNPGTVLLVRDDVDGTTAQRRIQAQPRELGLTSLQVQELIWRVTMPGTDSGRFERAPQRPA